MQKIDKYSIENIGISGVVLMENAGKGVTDYILDHFEDSRKIFIFCGKGNNGGDGFVVARHLHNKGKNVSVFIIGDKNKITGDAKVNLDIISKMGIRIDEYDEKNLKSTNMKLLHSDLIVDAIFGTGLDSPVRGIYGNMIDLINQSNKPVVSIDLPSGLCADHGRILGKVVKADSTLTFGLPKLCHYLYPAASFVGDLKIIDIGFPKDLESIKNINLEYISDIDYRDYLLTRTRDSHKGSFGHVLILGGSPGKTGAPIMAAEGALRCGAGLVSCGVPESLNPVLESQLIEAMTVPLAETSEKTLDHDSLSIISKFIKERKITTLAIGPGISTNPQTGKLVIDLIKKTKLHMVIDADALNLISMEKTKNFLTRKDAKLILTPHPGEMARLINKDIQYIRDNPINVAEDFAKKYGVILVLKGAPTIIASPEGKVFINSTGNPGLAKGGSGDVLTGIIAAFIHQVKDPLLAAILGVHLHGYTADLCSVYIPELSIVASDILQQLSEALNLLLVSD